MNQIQALGNQKKLAFPKASVLLGLRNLVGKASGIANLCSSGFLHMSRLLLSFVAYDSSVLTSVTLLKEFTESTEDNVYEQCFSSLSRTF